MPERLTITMAKIVVCLVGCLLFAATAHAEEHQPKQLDTAKAFRQCSLAQKVDPRTLTDVGKEAAKWCVGLAMAYDDGIDTDETGKPIPANYTLAAQYYATGCRLTVAFGCMAMGQMIEKGRATVSKGQDPRIVALSWYTKGCFAQDKEKGDIALSCGMGGGVAMAMALEKKESHAMAKLMKAAVQLDERACQLGDDTSCRVLVKVEQAFAGAK
jgi:TPR repeat protein